MMRRSRGNTKFRSIILSSSIALLTRRETLGFRGVSSIYHWVTPSGCARPKLTKRVGFFAAPGGVGFVAAPSASRDGVLKPRLQVSRTKRREAVSRRVWKVRESDDEMPVGAEGSVIVTFEKPQG